LRDVKKFLGLLLCLSLSFFIVARAAKPTHALRSQKEINSQELYAKSASFDMSDAEQDQVAADQDADQQTGSGDDNNNQNASGDQGANDGQDGAADAGEQDTDDDAEAVDTGTDDADDGGGE
jgi:hypothetical protein